MKSYITQIEIYDEDDCSEQAKLELEDGDCVKVKIDQHHTLHSWRELSALVEQGMIQMGLVS